MLHFDRQAVSRPQLVALDGTRTDDRAATSERVRSLLPVLVVIAATALAVVVDLLDTAPAWSHYAVGASAIVLAIHTLLTRP